MGFYLVKKEINTNNKIQSNSSSLTPDIQESLKNPTLPHFLNKKNLKPFVKQIVHKV